MRSDAFILNQKQQVSGLKRNVFRLDEFGEWERKCSRCELWLPFSEEFWYTYLSQGRDITQSHCIACEKERASRKRPKKPKTAKRKHVSFSINGFHYVPLSDID